MIVVDPDRIGKFVEITLRSGRRFYGKVLDVYPDAYVALEETDYVHGHKVCSKLHQVDASEIVAVTTFFAK